jgi:hypothetical protein
VTNQLVEILTNRRDRIIAAAVGTFDRRAGRYGELPVEELHARFAGLFDQVLAVVADRNAIPALRYQRNLPEPASRVATDFSTCSPPRTRWKKRSGSRSSPRAIAATCQGCSRP